jgi:hypothetical protein
MLRKVLILCIYLIPINLLAQCHWKSMPGPDIGSSIDKVIIVKNELYVTGDFDSIGGIHAKLLAKWDGIKWDSVSHSLNSDNIDYWTLGEYENQLYTADRPNNSNGYYARIKKWNGKTWEVIGTTNASWGKIPNSMMVTGPNIRMMKEFKGALYVVGNFDEINGIKAKNIARWDGKEWSPLQKGIDYDDMIWIDGMCEYRGKLYIAGMFDKADDKEVNNMACWDGNKWISIPGLRSNHLEALAVYNDELYVGGYFYNNGDEFKTGLMKWNEKEWTNVGDTLKAIVCSMAVYNGLLYAGFSRMTPQDGFYALAKWNNKTWSPMGGGVNNPNTIDSLGLSKLEYIVTRKITAMFVYKGDLYVTGFFYSLGNLPAYGIGRWSLQ